MVTFKLLEFTRNELMSNTDWIENILRLQLMATYIYVSTTNYYMEINTL